MDAFDVEGWRRSENDKLRGSIYRRPLGMTECGFYWDNVFNGVAITLNHLELEAVEGLEGGLFSKENLEAAWTRLKQRFPLLGSSTEEVTGLERVEFVVKEDRLRSIYPGEFSYLDLKSAECVERFSYELQNGPPVLGDTFLARVYAGPQLDAPRRYHIYIPVAHCITDGMANATIAREYCQELAKLSQEPAISAPLLFTRLQNLLPVEGLTSSAKLSPARRRWRLAIAKVIQTIRHTKMTVSTLLDYI